MEATKHELIEKEAVSGLSFPEADVLGTKEEKAQRSADLNMAMSLGNLEHTKIKIYFEDDTSAKVIDTTVWGLTDKRVILKQGLVIPIHRVIRIKF
jgi:nitrogen regulatory protein PII